MTEGLDLTDNGCSNLDERPFDWWDGHQPNVGILRNEDPWGGGGGGVDGTLRGGARSRHELCYVHDYSFLEMLLTTLAPGVAGAGRLASS